MMNPILIIIAVAVILSALTVTILNKPRIPIVASAFLVILIFFVVTTFFIDNAIADAFVSNSLNDFVRFVIMNDNPTYDDLEKAFTLFSYIDVGLFLATVMVMFTEAFYILRHNSGA